MSTEVIAVKSKNRYSAGAVFSAVFAAVFAAVGILSSVWEEEEALRRIMPFIWFAGAAALAVIAFVYGKKGRRIASRPNDIIVFSAGKLCVYAKEGYVEFAPRLIDRAEERHQHSRYRVFDSGDLAIFLKDGRIVTAENIASLGAAKQRLVELKVTEETTGSPGRP